MPESVKERNKRWFPVVVACIVLIGGAMWASALLPQQESREPTGVTGVVTDNGFPQLLRVREGVLELVAADGVTVLETYDVTVASLPIDEQERLAAGVAVSDEEELAALLENYTS
ncbi:MAG: hypothetical protein IKB04_00705 [Clostridia bacterium]|nr:hypothetical protein [Clostridia bacterium]